MASPLRARGLFLWATVVGLLPSFGCELEKFAPHAVSMGIARLTVRNAAVVLSALNADSRCGFASPGVLAHPTVEGVVGGVGQVTWTVQGCALDFGAQPSQVMQDCNGAVTKALGAVTVSGTKTVVGVLTGDPANPVVPQAADAVRFELDAGFGGLSATSTQSNAYLVWKKGSLHFQASPHLAVSASKQVCAVPVSNLTLSDVRYGASDVTVDDGKGHHFDASVDSSRYQAQVGQWASQENALTGVLSVWGTNLTLPSDHDGLDPAYNTVDFVNSYSCAADLEQPVSFACPSVQTMEAQGSARLSIGALGYFSIYLDSEPTCGFARPDVLSSPVLSGTLGEDGATATYLLPACTLHFPTRTVIATDCYGNELAVQGDVTVSGTKQVRGIMTGSSESPVVPTHEQAAQLDLRYDLSGFTFSDRPDRSITFSQGSVLGRILPYAAQDDRTGACSMATPVGHFQHVAIQDAKVTLVEGSTHLSLTVDDSDLEAQSSSKDGRTNLLTGRIRANGDWIDLPSAPGEATLDPEFDLARFTGSYSCTPHMNVPVSDAQCSMKQTLGENAARLLVLNAATAGKLVADDTSCGFDLNYPYSGQLLPDGPLMHPTQVVGSPGQLGSMSFHVGGCELVKGKLSTLGQDCNGTATNVEGSAVATADATIQGMRGKEFCILFICIGDTIYPVAPDQMALDLTQLSVKDYAVSRIPAGASEPDAKLVLHSGTLGVAMEPITGQRESKPDHYDVATPVAGVPSLEAHDLDATLLAHGMTIHLAIPYAHLTAFNGSFQGQSNALSGEIAVGDTVVTLPTVPLDPAFDQAQFDQSYACTPDLASVVSAQ